MRRFIRSIDSDTQLSKDRKRKRKKKNRKSVQPFSLVQGTSSLTVERSNRLGFQL